MNIFLQVNKSSQQKAEKMDVYICNVDKIWDRNVTANTINSILSEYTLCEIIEGNSYSILCEIKCEVSFSA